MAVDGVLLLDKPAGLTSNSALQRVKRLLGAQKAGHVGTLDPLATGLLPICVGEATKFSGQMLAADKAYAADVLLGATSATGDAEGPITSRAEVAVSREQVETVLARFRGEILQTPPLYSALKRDGRPLYAYARAGETVEREARPVLIHELTLTAFAPPVLGIEVRCGKGTYIRVLAEDIGRALGCGGMISLLRRLAVGPYGITDATSLAALEALDLTARRALLAPVDSLVADLPARVLDAAEMRLLTTGREARPPGLADGIYRLYAASARFLGVGEVLGGRLRARRLMATAGAAGESAHGAQKP